MNKEIGIYIHIPFCKSRCYYCDFFSSVNKEDLIEAYIDALCKELIQNAEIFSEYNIKTIYFGGGTPSYIDSKYIAKIMDIISLFSNNISEITIEINPGTVDIEKLKCYKELNINRLSIGLQTIYDDTLKSIGRVHTYNDFLATLDLAKKLEFNNISIDLIYPLPNINYSKFVKQIDEITKLKDKYDIKHISVYNLELHENTKLDFLIKEGFLTLCDEDEEYKMKEYMEEKLTESNFLKYEISNFAISGFESQHNLNYWRQGEYIGIGAGASSFFAGSRYTNINDIEKYIYNINNNISTICDKQDLDKLDLMKEFVILSLRLVKGMDKDKFLKKFNVNVNKIFKNEIEKLKKDKLIIEDSNSIFLTKRGMEVANIVWQEFV